MDKILELLSKILPLSRYYPRWAQAVFSVGLATLLLCIFVAIVGYSTASKEKESCEPPDSVRSTIANKVKNSERLFKQLGLSLSNWYLSVSTLRSDLLQYTDANPNVLSYAENTLPKELKADSDLVSANLQEISDALKAIHSDGFASQCWQYSAVKNGVFLARVRTDLMNRGFSESEASINPANIPYLTQFFSIAIHKLKDRKFLLPLQAVLTTNSADIPAVGKHINNENLRVFLIGGNLLFGLVQKKENGSAIIAFWGPAMISDIFRSIPDGEAFRAQLENEHSNYHCYVEKVPLAFSRDSLVDESFARAVGDLEKRQDLLVFEIPPNAPASAIAHKGT